MSKPLTAALFDSKIRNTRSPRFGAFEIGSTSVAPCMSARKGDTGAAKVSTLAFFLTSLDKNQLRVGIDPVDEKTMLVSKKGSTSVSSFRAVVDCSVSNIRVVTDANPEMAGMITGIVAGLIFTTKLKDSLVARDEMRFFSNWLKEDLKNNKPNSLFDAFYYDLKYSSMRGATIDFEYDKAAVDTAFARADSMQELEASESLSPLLKGNFPFVGSSSAAKPVEEAAKSPVDDELESFMESCRGGKYRVFDIYFPNDSDKIPSQSYLNNYAPTRKLKSLVETVYKVLSKAFGLKPGESRKQYATEMANVLNVMLFGPPGTGKTSMCRALCAALGIPMYHIVVSKNTEEQHFNKKPDFDKTGTIRMVDQAMRKVYANGGLILLDEVLNGDPGVMTYLNDSLEEPYAIGDGDEQILRSAYTIVAAAGNPGTEGTHVQNPAFFNRFGLCLDFEPTSREEMEEMIATRRTDLNLKEKKNAKAVEKIIDVYFTVRDGLMSSLSDYDQLQQVLSLRSVRSAVENLFDYGMTLREAVMIAIVNPAKMYLQTYADPDAMKTFNDRVWADVTKIICKDDYGKKYGTEA